MPPRRLPPSWCKELAGEIVDGKYKLLKYVGNGKIGFVYQAQRIDLPDAINAVKLTFDQLRVGWETEIRKVAQLGTIEGVVHFHDLGAGSLVRPDGKHQFQFTVWDYISPGEDLRRHLKRVGTVKTAFLVAVLERVLHVLHACHKTGVVRHGDLHAGNILIGDDSDVRLDDNLQPRAPIYVSDFGYGATGGGKTPKDDYYGLATILNEILDYIDRDTASSTDRQILAAVKEVFDKLLSENQRVERQLPHALLVALKEIQRRAKIGGDPTSLSIAAAEEPTPVSGATPSVGQFQVSEMIGERWDWWRALFVPTVPARTRILALDIPTVVTGPRGCGKTMLFRRLSERLIVECGSVPELPSHKEFVALYVNANDFADAFSRFPNQPTVADERQLICYANLCILADLLSVESSRASKLNEHPSDALLELAGTLLLPEDSEVLLEGEDRLQNYRSILEDIKWKFDGQSLPQFPGYATMCQHRWLPHLLTSLRTACAWVQNRVLVLFVDDYSLPRVTASMQRVLNRLFLQRSAQFLAKIATEASTTFLTEDSSGKNLQDGDDFQLVDIGEEAIFLDDKERLEFLSAIFSRRLRHDPRVPPESADLTHLMGRSGLSKTELARRLRSEVKPTDTRADGQPLRRRGRAAARVHYHGEDIFTDLWSGDTRTMIQLITELVDNAPPITGIPNATSTLRLPVDSETQDRVFRNRGGEWLTANTRNEPTDNAAVKRELANLCRQRTGYQLRGTYGEHLKAIVEAFVEAARTLLQGPTYRIREGRTVREVPRMAFRLEIVDEFRIDGLAREIYRDLIRFGIFMRDNRGKSVRGAFVPRLYVRRLLLPYARLALSKRDSVPLSCSSFIELLLEPDQFRRTFASKRKDAANVSQMELPLLASAQTATPDPAYDDIGIEGKPSAPKTKKRQPANRRKSKSRPK